MLNGMNQETVVRSATAEEFPGRYLIGQFPLVKIQLSLTSAACSSWRLSDVNTFAQGGPDLEQSQGPWDLQQLPDMPQVPRQRRVEKYVHLAPSASERIFDTGNMHQPSTPGVIWGCMQRNLQIATHASLYIFKQQLQRMQKPASGFYLLGRTHVRTRPRAK